MEIVMYEHVLVVRPIPVLLDPFASGVHSRAGLDIPFRFDSLTYFFSISIRFSILVLVSRLFEWWLEGRRLEKNVWHSSLGSVVRDSISRVLYCQYASVPHPTLPKESLTPKHRFRRLSVLRGAEKRITTTTTCEFYLHVYLYFCVSPQFHSF